MCVNFLKRSYRNEIYFYCKKKRKKVTIGECKNCNCKEYRKNEIKKKSSKLAKLERKRDKGIVKSGICDYCHNYSKRLDPHEVYGGCNRSRSIRNGFVKMLCRDCHEDDNVIAQLKIDVQKEYEETHTREEFIEITGKSYIKS